MIYIYLCIHRRVFSTSLMENPDGGTHTQTKFYCLSSRSSYPMLVRCSQWEAFTWRQIAFVRVAKCIL